MPTNDKQYYIYLRSTHERIPCTKQEFDNYYRDINTFRKTQQRHGKCVCPEKKRLDCDMDCATCPFRRAGDSVSLDYTVSNDDGEEITWVNSVESTSPLIDDIVADSERMAELFERLKELMPQAIEIGKLRQQGIPDVQIAELIGVHRNTFGSRLNRVKEILKKEFPEFF